MNIPDRGQWPEDGLPDMNDEQLLDLLFILSGFFPEIAGLEIDHEGKLLAWLGEGPGQHAVPASLALSFHQENEMEPPTTIEATMPSPAPAMANEYDSPQYIAYMKELEEDQKRADSRRGKDAPSPWGTRMVSDEEPGYFCSSCWYSGSTTGFHPDSHPPCDPIPVPGIHRS